MPTLCREEVAETIAENEARLVAFFSSGEPETTSTFEFRQVHRPLSIHESSEKAGCGLFVKDPAAAGDLLIVDNVFLSVASSREYTPYKEDSYVHAPKADWKPQRPRIPPEVHDYLANKLRDVLAPTNAGADFEFVMSLDSRDPNESFSKSWSPANCRFLSWLDQKPMVSSSHGNEPDDLPRLLKNIVANNAICNKVRTLSKDEPRQVETLEWWGLWFLVSYVNHSCAPNCHRMRVGRAMFIRAATDIAAGEELTLPYFDIFEPLTLRDAHCQTFGFRCECCRCTFERSLEKPYNDIQMQIIQLKIQLQTEWKVNATASEGKAKMILQQLADLVFPIHNYTVSDEILPQTRRLHTKSSKRASKFRKKDREKDLMTKMLHKYWIEASFIDAFIAMYALCAVRPFTGLKDGFDPILYLESLEQNFTTSRSEEGQIAQRTIYTVIQVLTIITEVHPGNMLGQEFHSIGVKAYRKLLNSNDPGLDLAAERGNLERFILGGIGLYSRYYGCLDKPVLLEELLEIES